MKRLIHIAFLLLSVLPLSAQQMYMQVQVRKPAEVNIDAAVRNLLLVNNTPLTTEQPRFLLFAAANALAESDRFDEVSVLPSLSATVSVDSLCDRYESDALLALNALVFDGSLANAYWTVHYKGGRSFSFFTDTDLHSCDGDNDCAAYVGEQLIFIIAPHWETEERYLYRNDNTHILAGLNAVSHKDWSAAITEWSKALSDKDESKAYAAANMAVAYEMLDQYNTAMVWVNNAITYFRRLRSSDAAQQVVNLRYYLSQLEERKNTNLL